MSTVRKFEYNLDRGNPSLQQQRPVESSWIVYISDIPFATASNFVWKLVIATVFLWLHLYDNEQYSTLFENVNPQHYFYGNVTKLL